MKTQCVSDEWPPCAFSHTRFLPCALACSSQLTTPELKDELLIPAKGSAWYSYLTTLNTATQVTCAEYYGNLSLTTHGSTKVPVSSSTCSSWHPFSLSLIKQVPHLNIHSFKDFSDWTIHHQFFPLHAPEIAICVSIVPVSLLGYTPANLLSDWILCIQRSGSREGQPSGCTLPLIIQLSSSEKKSIHLRVGTLGPIWSVLPPPRRAHPGSLRFLSLRDMGLTLLETGSTWWRYASPSPNSKPCLKMVQFYNN